MSFRHHILRHARRLVLAVRWWALRSFVDGCVWAFRLEEVWNPAPPASEKRVLAAVFGGLGDSLLCDSVFRRIREVTPGVRIDVVTAGFDAMWDELSSVDRVYYLRLDRPKTLRARARFFRRIYRERYAIAAEVLAMLPLTGSLPLFPSLLLRASRAPVRIGRPSTGARPALRPSVISHARGPGESAQARAPRLLTHVVRPPSATVRSVHESSYVLRPLGIEYFRGPGEPHLSGNPDAQRWARSLLQEHWRGEDSPLVGVVFETTYDLKGWPLERFLAVMERGIAEGMRFVVVGLGTEASKEMGRRFSPRAVLDLSGLTNLAQLMGIIRECDLFLGCDSGPAHLAQAYGVSTVVLFGPSNEREFGPSDPHRHLALTPPEPLECRPCVMGPCILERSCMHRISAEQVHAALMSAVAAIPRHQRTVEAPGLTGNKPRKVVQEL